MKCEKCGETTTTVRCEHCGHRKVEHLSVEEFQSYLEKAKKTLDQRDKSKKSNE